MINSKYGLPVEGGAHVDQQLAQQRADRHEIGQGIENLHWQRAIAAYAELERRQRDA